MLDMSVLGKILENCIWHFYFNCPLGHTSLFANPHALPTLSVIAPQLFEGLLLEDSWSRDLCRPDFGLVSRKGRWADHEPQTFWELQLAGVSTLL